VALEAESDIRGSGRSNQGLLQPRIQPQRSPAVRHEAAQGAEAGGYRV